MLSERGAAWWASQLDGQILPRAKRDEHSTASGEGSHIHPGQGGPQAPSRAPGSLLHLRNFPSLYSFQLFPPRRVVGSPPRENLGF